MPSRKKPVGALIAAALLAGCAAAPPPSTTSTAVAHRAYDIPCQEAFRIAAKTLHVRGHEVTDVQRGPSGGTVSGSNGDESLEVRLSCGAAGVTVGTDAGHWLDQGVKMSFAGFVDQGDRIWPPPKAPKLFVEPLYGPEAKIEFPQELEPLGMTALRVRLVNGGSRGVTIEPRRIRGKTPSGSAVAAISPEGVKQKLGSDPEVASKILGTTTLKQGEEVRGFVFLPAGRYASVVVKLVDEPTGEADEFEIFLRES